jgi:hypothetical protein
MRVEGAATSAHAFNRLRDIAPAPEQQAQRLEEFHDLRALDRTVVQPEQDVCAG